MIKDRIGWLVEQLTDATGTTVAIAILATILALAGIGAALVCAVMRLAESIGGKNGEA